MKFLIYIPQLIFGGAEKVLVSFANDLVSRGHEVEVLELYEKGFLKPQFDCKVCFNAICSEEYTRKYYSSLQDVKSEKNCIEKFKKCGKLVFSKIVGYRKFAEKLAAKHYKNRQFDVAINYLEIESPKFILEHINAKKCFQWIHTDITNSNNPNEFDAFLPFYEKLDGVFCVAKSVRKSFVRKYPSLNQKTYTLYNFFQTQKIKENGNEPFSFETQKPVLLSVGRLTEPKKYLRFIDVLKKLSDDGYKFSFHILGVGAQEDAIRQKINDYSLTDRIFLDGVTENPYKYIKNCDLFCLPSGWEGFPTVTIEAKILEKPVLATDVSGIREQLVHGETGWIVENSEKAIYEGLKHLLDNPELVLRLKSNEGMNGILDNNNKYEKFISSVV